MARERTPIPTRGTRWPTCCTSRALQGPGGSTGFSTCIKRGKPVRCSWSDKTQAEAYAHTLQAFFKYFPEFSDNGLYLAGESYFGQYGPNIAHFILNNAPFSTSLRISGLLVGNGCWGKGCNGPNSDQNDVDMYYGKGLMSKALYAQTYDVCGFPTNKTTVKCEAALMKMHTEVGPHNVYDIYDNCPRTVEYLNKTGRSMRWLLQHAREQLVPQSDGFGATAQGGYDWSCGDTYPPGAISPWFSNTTVQKALNLNKPGQSGFSYSGGDPTLPLYPELVKKIRVLIYNGDADACVPYKGNEEWTTGLAAQGVVTEAEAWRPWFSDEAPDVPAGYVTTYNVTGSGTQFSFLTIRLSGHMVPMFRPAPALTFLKRFLAGDRL